jgi:hypothetical protein
MSSKSTNQVSEKSIAFIDSQLEYYLSAIGGVGCETAAIVIDSPVNEPVDREDTSGEISTTEVILFEMGELSPTTTIDVIGDVIDDIAAEPHETIALDVIDDIAAEPHETITVTLSDSVATVPTTNWGTTVTASNIIDDDEILQILSLIQLI